MNSIFINNKISKAHEDELTGEVHLQFKKGAIKFLVRPKSAGAVVILVRSLEYVLDSDRFGVV